VQGKGDGKDGLGGSGNLVLKEEESATLAAIFFSSSGNCVLSLLTL
jgi:hypothetical protein